MPEYSPIIVDELIFLFFNRQWQDKEQIDGVKLFNTCRDRHLLFIGNIPNFFQADAGLRNSTFFYVFIPERTRAWIFQKELNPFTRDPWNEQECKKLFRYNKSTPYKVPNFVGEVYFPKMTPEEDKGYRDLRNSKRVKALRKRAEKEDLQNMNKRDKRIVYQRNILMRELHKQSGLNKSNFALKYMELLKLGKEGIKDVLK